MTPFPRRAYRSLSRYEPDRRSVDVDLSDNTNRWGAHPAALQVLREAEARDLVSYPPVYADHLRAAVARRFGVPHDAVTTGPGSDGILDSTFRASGDPGEGVAFLPPTFSMVEVMARMNGLEPRPVQRDEPRRGAPFGPLPDPEALLADGPALVYLCRPNNPTGEVFPLDWVREVAAAAGPEGPLVLVDEAYADFLEVEEGGSGSELLREAADSPRMVVLRTFSKAYGLAGLRVGFAVGSPAVVLEIEKSRGPYKVSRVAERAAATALADEEEWVPTISARVRRERAGLREALEERGFSPLPSGANFLLLPLHGRKADETAAALREEGVAVRPFPDLPGFGDTVRISIGPRGEMQRFVEALERVMDR